LRLQAACRAVNRMVGSLGEGREFEERHDRVPSLTHTVAVGTRSRQTGVRVSPAVARKAKVPGKRAENAPRPGPLGPGLAC
jgi:hypothetical protein